MSRMSGFGEVRAAGGGDGEFPLVPLAGDMSLSVSAARTDGNTARRVGFRVSGCKQSGDDASSGLPGACFKTSRPSRAEVAGGDGLADSGVLTAPSPTWPCGCGECENSSNANGLRDVRGVPAGGISSLHQAPHPSVRCAVRRGAGLDQSLSIYTALAKLGQATDKT